MPKDAGSLGRFLPRFVREEKLLAFLILGALALWVSGRVSPAQAFQLVEWRTIGTLLGLIALCSGLEECGYFQWAGAAILRSVRTERQVALVFVVGAAALASVLTNDVSLFVVVPMTLGLAGRLPDFPLGRLVIFEALAVNAGSALTPIGNPQNLFIWQQSASSFLGFVRAMTPLALVLLALLITATFFAFPSAELGRGDPPVEAPLDRGLLVLSALLYAPFLLASETRFLAPALLALLGCYALLERRVLFRIDWNLLLLFVLLFIDLRGIARIGVIHRLALASVSLPHGPYLAGAFFSQLISNVPATILLQSVHPLSSVAAWKGLAWGVNVGGFGLAIGSLANLIALRLSRMRGLWREFHLWSIGMLVAGYFLGQLIL